ncbi:hypothetical protein SEA_ATUIN_34 [Arthrobacter phage Atuin]|nr:hypothetical protein SEA_ATUIN_133 [Arthrobacter phage Atuin]
MNTLTESLFSEIFPEEITSAYAPKDAEVYEYSTGWTLYVVRTFNKDGYPVPPMDAYLVAIHADGTREDLRTNSADEITAWANMFR